MTNNPYAPPKSETTGHHSTQKYPTLKLVSVVALGHIGFLLLSFLLISLFNDVGNVFDSLLPMLIFSVLISSIPTLIISLFIVLKKYTKSTNHLIHLFLLIFIVTVLNALFWSYVSLTLYSGHYPSYLIDVLPFVFAVGFVFAIVMTAILRLILPSPNSFIKDNTK